VIAPVSSVWRAPDGALGPVELGDGKQRGRQTSSGFDEVKKEEASAVCPCPGEKGRRKGGPGGRLMVSVNQDYYEMLLSN
jgi:hypothetical protein